MANNLGNNVNTTLSVAAVIVSGGSGTRMTAGKPKQYLPMFGMTVLRRTLEIFHKHPAIHQIQVVIGSGHQELYTSSASDIDLLPPVIGGPNRQASVLAGLRALASTAPDIVLIHDAARPFVSAQIIDEILASISPGAGAVPALAISDSLRRGCDGEMIESLDRAGLYRVQTPQGFIYREILKAHESRENADFTDDTAIAREAGISVKLVSGEEENFKITTVEDLQRAERQLSGQYSDVRTGQGFDVHRFCDGNSLTLCGEEIPHSYGLLGHSDADVALHAITDAVLGAAALGDIGEHFPDTEPQWKNKSSEIFLRHALDLADRAGGVPAHVDLTIICQEPKIGPYREVMRGNLSRILKLPIGRISVKATTTEGLGFAGRKEGIAAQAIASLRFRPNPIVGK